LIGESHLGHVPLHRIRQGLMLPPLIKSGLGAFMLLPQVIHVENPNGWMPDHRGA
jgi:hypothetical protein